MNGIGDFLKKYLDFTPPEKIIAKATISALKEILDIEITSEQLLIKNGVVFVSTDTVIKSEIVFQKKKVLMKIQELLGKETVVDIR